jgi:peptidoglycan L-alanyl-D-glutamate endopeptidase CwlK
VNQPSLDRLNQCHPDLIKLMLRVDQIYPIQVICGFRGEKDQNIAFENKKSKLKFPNSKHNYSPSLAVDVVPDPDRNTKTISWMDLMAFEIMCLAIELVADDLEIKIRLGRDFTFKDWPHVELINKK